MLNKTTILIVGLGNPGSEHENTRHNVGFAVVDAFGEKYQIVGKQDDNLLCWYGKGENVILAWPTTFMNKSGEAVLKLINWYKLNINDLIVVHDDVSLNPGRIKVAFGRGAAGHHGAESIIQTLGGTEEFTRLRIGIGPDPGGDKRADYVLKEFTVDEDKLVKRIIDISIEALETIITKGVGEAMNKFNGIEVT